MTTVRKQQYNLSTETKNLNPENTDTLIAKMHKLVSTWCFNEVKGFLKMSTSLHKS